MLTKNFLFIVLLFTFSLNLQAQTTSNLNTTKNFTRSRPFYIGIQSPYREEQAFVLALIHWQYPADRGVKSHVRLKSEGRKPVAQNSLTWLMAYNQKLAQRIREALAGLSNIEEKAMMGGLTFMYNGKMCVGIIADEMMCRIDPALHEKAIEKTGCRTMDFTKRPMKGYIMIADNGMKTKEAFMYWINLCLEFNSQARASKKKK